MPETKKIIRFNTLLAKSVMKDQKRDLIAQVSNGRTESTKELTDAELQQLIDGLQGLQPKPQDNNANKMRRYILSMAHQMNWYVTNEEGDFIMKKGKPVLDFKRINNWCVKFGSFGKQLNDHSVKELTTLTTNFERVLKHSLSKKD
jgi:hypothetical protein